MKPDMFFWKRGTLLIFIGCVGLLSGLFVGVALLAQGPPYLIGGPSPPSFCVDLSCLETTHYRVNLGDERTKAIQLLASNAWYHGVCYDTNTSSEDIFFYGGRHRDRAHLRIVHSTMAGGSLRVDQFGSFDQPQWVAYDSCIPSSIWASDFQKPEILSIIGGFGLILAERFWLRRFINLGKGEYWGLEVGILLSATFLIGFGLFYLLLSVFL